VITKVSCFCDGGLDVLVLFNFHSSILILGFGEFGNLHPAAAGREAKGRARWKLCQPPAFEIDYFPGFFPGRFGLDYSMI
jgi:hypothetical protein